MRKEIEEILFNPTNEGIAKLGIMLADADKKLMEIEIEKIKNKSTVNNEERIQKLEKMALVLNKEEFTAYKKKLDETDNNSDIEAEFLAVKADYRELAIAFDTVRLIVQNKSHD
jgi:hypothetical protein